MKTPRFCTGCRYLKPRHGMNFAECLAFQFPLSNQFATPETPDECKHGAYPPREDVLENLVDSKIAAADQMRQTLNQQRAFINAVLGKVKERMAEGSCDEEDDRIISLAADHKIGNVRRVKYDHRIHGVIGDCDDGQEIYWWGSEKTDEELLREFQEDAKKWECSCGAKCDPVSPAWRWCGEYWEHHHGGQAGHFPARKLQ